MNGALTALGIRHTPDGLAQVLGQSMPLCDRTASASATQPDNANPEGLITCVLTPGGDPLAWERAGQVHKGGLHSPQSHAVLGGQTALVRHLYVTTQVGEYGGYHCNALSVHWHRVQLSSQATLLQVSKRSRFAAARGPGCHPAVPGYLSLDRQCTPLVVGTWSGVAIDGRVTHNGCTLLYSYCWQLLTL